MTEICLTQSRHYSEQILFLILIISTPIISGPRNCEYREMLIFGLILVDLINRGNGQVINWAANQTAGPIQDADGILKPGIIHIHAPPPANETSETQAGFQMIFLELRQVSIKMVEFRRN